MTNSGKARALALVLPALAAAAATLTASVAAAEEPKVVNIVKNADNKFVFDQENITITKGQVVTWAGTGPAPHQLVPETEQDSFKDTGEFTSTEEPAQKFNKPGVIRYRCAIHPSMTGTITVKEAAKAGAPKAEAPKADTAKAEAPKPNAVKVEPARVEAKQAAKPAAEVPATEPEAEAEGYEAEAPYSVPAKSVTKSKTQPKCKHTNRYNY